MSISWPNVVGKFGVFYDRKRNTEFCQYPVPQKSSFYRRWRLLRKLYLKIYIYIFIFIFLYLYFYIYILKICTNDYDNHEYLAVKKLDFLPGISYDVCNEMFINEEKRWHENEATIPT